MQWITDNWLLVAAIAGLAFYYRDQWLPLLKIKGGAAPVSGTPLSQRVALWEQLRDSCATSGCKDAVTSLDAMVSHLVHTAETHP